MTEAVIIRGDKDGVRILINASFTPLEIKEVLRRKIASNRKFFHHASFHIGSTTLEKVSPELYEDLVKILKEEFELEILTEYETYIRDYNGEIVAETVFVPTVVAGERVISQGHLVVLGNVDPGGEVQANGNIIIMGWLRGIAHAGYAGNSEMYIMTRGFRTDNSMVRIADYTLAVRQAGNDSGLEQALVVDGELLIINYGV